MNVVKMQDTLKDLSDRQLMQTMQTGSAPQYLVLAEMQRRKKARDSARQQSQRQPERSVAEDIISGIAAVPTGPMQMAGGGLVSFAKGGKTGRMKGEEEACYTDSRTGEKYCPPSRPQMETPRKRFQEGGMIPPEEMVEMDVARRLQELQRMNPNATRYDAIQALMREGAYGLPAAGGVMAVSDTAATPAAPAAPSPQPEVEEPGFFRRGINWLEENVGPVLEDIAPGEGVLQRDPTESADVIRVRGEEGEYETLGERAQRVAAEEQTAAAEETVRREEEAARENVYAEPTPEPAAEPEPETDTATEEDGLMQLVRELREERAGIQAGARERALNEALIRGGLAMAASDRPDFLAAAAEGGIGGLAGYQSAMERAAERQGEISADVSDLIIAREANDLRRQAAAASAYNANIRAQQAQIGNIIDMLEAEQKSLNEGLGVMSEEEQLATQQRVDALRAQLNALMGTGQSTGGAGENILGYGEDALVETP